MHNDSVNRTQKLLVDMEKEVEIIINGSSVFLEKTEAMLNNISQYTNKLSIVIKQDQSLSYFFKISGPNRGEVFYKALPEELEWEPFVRTIREFSRTNSHFESGLDDVIKTLSEKTCIEVAISPHCPYCGNIVTGVNSLAAHHHLISVTVIDVALDQEFVKSNNIMSAPTILINNQFAFVGQTSLQTIVHYITEHDEVSKMMLVLKKLMDVHEEQRAVREFIQSSHGPESISRFATAPELSSRLAALTLLELCLEECPEQTRKAVPFLIKQLEHPDITILCDVILALSILGDKRAIPHLSKLQNHPNQDVQEGVEEALEELGLDDTDETRY